jgi:hypothetical protein
MLRQALLTFAVSVAALAFGASSSKAFDIDFGDMTTAAIAGGCTSRTAPNPGSVCSGNSLMFPGTPAGNITAISYLGSPNAEAGGFLTFKAIDAFNGAPPNGLGESGLGVNTNAAPGCSDPDCEIALQNAISVQSQRVDFLTSVLVASAQALESFNPVGR